MTSTDDSAFVQCSQQAATESCVLPAECSLQPHAHFFKVRFNIILSFASNTKFPQVVSYLDIFTDKKNVHSFCRSHPSHFPFIIVVLVNWCSGPATNSLKGSFTLVVKEMWHSMGMRLPLDCLTKWFFSALVFGMSWGPVRNGLPAIVTECDFPHSLQISFWIDLKVVCYCSIPPPVRWFGSRSLHFFSACWLAEPG